MAAAMLAIGVLCLSPRRGSTHEPITTNVRFNKEIIRIFERSCLDCHAAGKIKADIPLTTYEEARPWAKAIKEEVLEKRMPPFQAVKGFGTFHRDYGLSQREIDLLISWVEGGAPKGDAKELPVTKEKTPQWLLGQPDVVLKPAADSKLSPQEDSLRCFILPTQLKEDRWVSGIEFKPGNETVVYSATMGLATASKKVALRRQGSCADDIREVPLASWVPGQVATSFPKGIARSIPAGSSIVLKIRYRGNGEAQVDRSAVGLLIAKEEPQKEITSLAIAAPASLPPSTGPVRVKSSHTITAQAEVVGLRPLLFPYANSIEATAYLPDGTSEVLVWARNRRFDWNPLYVLKRPLLLPAGTRIDVIAYLDNSPENPNNPNDPPKLVKFSDTLCEVLIAQPASARVASTRKF